MPRLGRNVTRPDVMYISVSSHFHSRLQLMIVTTLNITYGHIFAQVA